ncbi:hypothetical protein BD324DRAFT_648165 [Kockovaella imperatae]|uniref:N-acetyltransferase domain-containing protein n=1 Tax=Kockovaella imperatae TaxID=4999 RepID=A0A1Y1UTF1_9TREE|nr:hypothetical protein BD324DRAFT_648165 [Kockovaella imperatae]ORX41291.1 hypothetical protein BD324DRAFT_648165 [Kockovaella imperatae]
MGSIPAVLHTGMTHLVKIHPAIPDDIPTLAEINWQAYRTDPMFKVGFVNWPDDEHMKPFFYGRVKGRFEIPKTVMYKAVGEADGVIHGFIALTEEEDKKQEEGEVREAEDGANEDIKQEVQMQNGSSDEPRHSAQISDTPSTTAATPDSLTTLRPTININELSKNTGTAEYFKAQNNSHEFTLPDYLNAEMMLSTRDGIMPMMNAIAKSGKHYYISAFAVRPESQGQGIGSNLIDHCIKVVEKDPSKIPIWLIALPSSHHLCLTHGFVDKDHCDMDLDKYDAQRRQLGVYRQWAMRRETV